MRRYQSNGREPHGVPTKRQAERLGGAHMTGNIIHLPPSMRQSKRRPAAHARETSGATSRAAASGEGGKCGTRPTATSAAGCIYRDTHATHGDTWPLCRLRCEGYERMHTSRPESGFGIFSVMPCFGSKQSFSQADNVAHPCVYAGGAKRGRPSQNSESLRGTNSWTLI